MRVITPKGFSPAQPDTYRKGFVMNDGRLVAWMTSSEGDGDPIHAEGEQAMGLDYQQAPRQIRSWFGIGPDNTISFINGDKSTAPLIEQGLNAAYVNDGWSFASVAVDHEENERGEVAEQAEQGERPGTHRGSLDRSGQHGKKASNDEDEQGQVDHLLPLDEEPALLDGEAADVDVPVARDGHEVFAWFGDDAPVDGPLHHIVQMEGGIVEGVERSAVAVLYGKNVSGHSHSVSRNLAKHEKVSQQIDLIPEPDPNCKWCYGFGELEGYPCPKCMKGKVPPKADLRQHNDALAPRMPRRVRKDMQRIPTQDLRQTSANPANPSISQEGGFQKGGFSLSTPPSHSPSQARARTRREIPSEELTHYLAKLSTEYGAEAQRFTLPSLVPDRSGFDQCPRCKYVLGDHQVLLTSGCPQCGLRINRNAPYDPSAYEELRPRTNRPGLDGPNSVPVAPTQLMNMTPRLGHDTEWDFTANNGNSYRVTVSASDDIGNSEKPSVLAMRAPLLEHKRVHPNRGQSPSIPHSISRSVTSEGAGTESRAAGPLFDGTFQTPPELPPYERGHWTKGFLLDGQGYLWNAENDDHHFHGLNAVKGTDLKWSDDIVNYPAMGIEPFWVDFTGKVEANSPEVAQQVAAAHPDFRYEPDEQWSFSKAANNWPVLEYEHDEDGELIPDETGTWDFNYRRTEAPTEPWEPGSYGKGIIYDGQPYIWKIQGDNEQGAAGSPHHYEVADGAAWSMGYGANADDELMENPIFVAPDGRIENGSYHSAPDLPELNEKYLALHPNLYLSDGPQWNFAKAGMALSPQDAQNWMQKNGPYLLHWTRPENVRGILERGIMPGDAPATDEHVSDDPWQFQPGDVRRNWEGYLQTRPGHTYLTVPGGPIEQNSYSDARQENPYGVPVRVDLRQLDLKKLKADEDYAVDAWEDWKNQAPEDEAEWMFDPPSSNMYDPDGGYSRGDWAEEMGLGDPNWTNESLGAGSVAYEGAIPPQAVSLHPDYEYPEEALKYDPNQTYLFDRTVAKVANPQGWSFAKTANIPIKQIDAGQENPFDIMGDRIPVLWRPGTYRFKGVPGAEDLSDFPDLIYVGQRGWTHPSVERTLGRLDGIAPDHGEYYPDRNEFRWQGFTEPRGSADVINALRQLWPDMQYSSPSNTWNFGKTATIPTGWGNMYHVSPRKNRESIMQNGLTGYNREQVGSPWAYHWDQPKGNYFFDNPEDALDYVYNLKVRNGGLHDEDNLPWDEMHEREEEPEGFWDWNEEDQNDWYDNTEYRPREEDPDGYDVWQVNVAGVPLLPDQETRIFDDQMDLGILYEQYQNQAGAWQNPPGIEQLHSDMIGYYGGEPNRYYSPTNIPVNRISLYQHVPTWELTEQGQEERADEMYGREAPQSWHRLPFTERPLPGHESRTANVNIREVGAAPLEQEYNIQGIEWRRPFLYDVNQATVFLGPPGSYHQQIQDYVSGDFIPGYVDLEAKAVEAYKPIPEVTEAVAQFLGPDYQAVTEPEWHFGKTANFAAQTPDLFVNQATPMWDFTASLNGLTPWQPGKAGKGLVHNGQVLHWAVDAHIGGPHHAEVLKDLGLHSIEDLHAARPFWIYEDGQLEIAPYTRGWTDYDPAKAAKQIARQIPGTRPKDNDDIWSFGSVRTAHSLEWTPGQPGKAAIFGSIDRPILASWNVDAEGNPHHYDIMPKNGIGNFIALEIKPDGEVSVLFGDPSAATDAAKIDPRLRANANNAWNFSKVAALEVLEAGSGDGEWKRPGYEDSVRVDARPIIYIPRDHRLLVGKPGGGHQHLGEQFYNFEDDQVLGGDDILHGYVDDAKKRYETWDSAGGWNTDPEDIHPEVLQWLTQQGYQRVPGTWSFSKVASWHTVKDFVKPPLSPAPTPQEAAQGRMCSFHPDQPAVAAEGFAAMCDQCYRRWQQAQQIVYNRRAAAVDTDDPYYDPDFADDETWEEEHAEKFMENLKHDYSREEVERLLDEGWEPGQTGKAIKLDDGTELAWTPNEVRSPHHQQVAQALGITHLRDDQYFDISREGEWTQPLLAQTWDFFG